MSSASLNLPTSHFVLTWGSSYTDGCQDMDFHNHFHFSDECQWVDTSYFDMFSIWLLVPFALLYTGSICFANKLYEPYDETCLFHWLVYYICEQCHHIHESSFFCTWFHSVCRCNAEYDLSPVESHWLEISKTHHMMRRKHTDLMCRYILSGP